MRGSATLPSIDLPANPLAQVPMLPTPSTPRLAVIIPVYKVEPYLRACLDSVCAQTFADLRIILVDDGSPDSCGAICDEYAGRDE